jgi:hypothetical protein
MNLKIRSISIMLALIPILVLVISASKNFTLFSFVQPAFSQQPAPIVSPTPVSDVVIDLPEPLNYPFETESEMTAENVLDGGLGSTDFDCDGVKNIADNCVLVFNPDQKNSDLDRYGDACDKKPKVTSKASVAVADDAQYSSRIDSRCDMDKDGIFDRKDNCPLVCNRNQKDSNKNGIGDACESRNGFDKICPGVTKSPKAK